MSGNWWQSGEVKLERDGQRYTDPKWSLEDELERAVMIDDLQKVRRLISRGADVNAERFACGRLLLTAALRACPEIVQTLRAAGAEPDHWEALVLEEHALLAAFLGGEVNIDARHKLYGFTLLSRAAEQGSAESVRLLLAHGAEIDATTRSGMTPLLLAALNKRSEATALLAAAGAAVGIIEATALQDREVLLRSLKTGADLDAASTAGMTPLMAAAACGYLDLMQLLLDHGAALNHVQRGKDTERSALAEAILYNQQDAVHFLLDAGMDIDAPGYRDNAYLAGVTPLFHAIMGRLTEMTRLLLDRGASVSIRDIRGKTPLHWAANRCTPEIVRALLAAGADANAADSQGKTPLMDVAFQTFVRADYQCASARLLIDHGADVNAQESDGDTALMRASMNGNTELAKLLLDAGADTEIRDKHGFTALTTPGLGDRAEVLSLLRERAPKPPYKPSRFPFPH